MKDNNILAIAMSAAVPLHIISLKDKGGPTKEDFSALQETSDILGEKGDILLFGSNNKKDKGLCADIFNKTAKAIAILSFVPGGINIFGQHYLSFIETREK